jgi:hypothetical protein
MVPGLKIVNQICFKDECNEKVYQDEDECPKHKGSTERFKTKADNSYALITDNCENNLNEE